jgi:hypothetical protein
MIAADGFFPRLPGSHSQGLAPFILTSYSILGSATVLYYTVWSQIFRYLVLNCTRIPSLPAPRLPQASTVQYCKAPRSLQYTVQYSTVQYSLTVELPTQGYIYYKATFGASEVAFSETDEAFFFFSGGHFSKTKKGMFVSTSSHSRGVTQ